MYDFFHRISAREKVMVLAGGAFVLTALVYGLMFAPAVNSRDRWHSMTDRKRAELEQFEELGRRYRELSAMLSNMEGRLKSRGGGESLLARMEAEARELGVKDHITSMKPFRNELDGNLVESSVEIRLEKMDLRSVVNLLRNIEAGDNLVRTKRLRVKSRFDDPDLLDVTLLVGTLETK